MSWESEIYNLYDKIKELEEEDSSAKMLPLSHSTQNAQIEITVDEHGNMKSADIVPKECSETVIPVTEDSGARSSGVAPHPLADKLIYIAGDYKDYAVFAPKDKVEDKFIAYIDQLRRWAEDPCAAAGVKAVYNYLKQGRLIKDLLNAKVLEFDEKTGRLSDSKKIGTIDQQDSFARFRVQYDDYSKEPDTWLDSEMYENFIAYLAKNDSKSELCYATGRLLPPTYKHPSKIRNAGDKAKLISSNDESGFTYRGRFEEKEQALSVSYDFSQRFHNALKWLIQNQGIVFQKRRDEKSGADISRRGYAAGLSLFAWASSLAPLPDFAESAALVTDYDDLDDFDDDYEYDPKTYYIERLKRSLFGKGGESFDPADKVMVMALDSAIDGKGRLNVSYYSELANSVFSENVERWHEDISWRTYVKSARGYGVNSFSVYEIITRAFGTEQKEKQKYVLKCKPEVEKENILRLIPCIIEGRRTPADIVSALVRKASRPLSYNEEFNHGAVVSTACGLLKRRYKERKVDVSMDFDENCRDRSYLYGALLAIAELAEKATYKKDEISRVPNARRYWEKFVQSPYKTWGRLVCKLEPYLEKNDYRAKYQKAINDIQGRFTLESFTDNSALEPIYLLGYSHVINQYYDNIAKKKAKNEEEEK